MPFDLGPITTVNINGHTYDLTTFEANPWGTFANIANDVAAVQAALDLVGQLSKAITTSVTLSGPESQNISFLFTGTLAAIATVTFPGSFAGIAAVYNDTSGGYAIDVGYAAGAAVRVPAGGSAMLLADGTDFILLNGVRSTGTGAETTGDFTVNGDLAATGTLDVTGNVTLSGSLSVAQALIVLSSGANITGDSHVYGDLTVDNALTTNSTLTVTNQANLNGALVLAGNATIDGTITGAGSSWTLSRTGGATIEVLGTTAEVSLVASANNAVGSYLELQKATARRWLVGRFASETGVSNVGSDLEFRRYDDDGSTALGTPFLIKRGTGYILMQELPTTDPSISGALWCDTAADRVIKVSA